MEVYDLTGAREMLTLEKAKEIAKTIVDNAKTLKRVVLGTKTYKADVAKVVADALSQATELEELDLADTISGLSFDEAQDTCEVFVDCLKHLHLKYLDLSSNALGPKGVASFKELISGNKDLEVLLFNTDGMSADACENIRAMVCEHAPMGIKRLEFHDNMSGNEGAKAIADMLYTLPNLEFFRWSGARSGEEGSMALCKALTHCPQMRHLEFNDNYFGENCGEVLAEAIASMKQLKELIIRDLGLGDEGLKPVFDELMKDDRSKLRVLDIGRNDITDESVQLLCELLKKEDELEVLALDGSDLVSCDLPLLLETLKSNCPKLSKLSVNGNGLEEMAVSVVDMCYILFTLARAA